MVRLFRRGSLLLLLLATAVFCTITAFTHHTKNKKTVNAVSCCTKADEKACVFLTLLGFEPFDATKLTFDDKLVDASLKSGLTWIMQAQQDNGGWGAGSHYHQEVRDPHAVPADPATTALVSMALLRTETKPFEGTYSSQLKKAVNFLIEAVDNSASLPVNITNLTNTQPQIKLGKNIDVILTAQFFTNALHNLDDNPDLKKKVKDALDKCVAKIQKGQDSDGGWKEGGWAPVLQSALANNALESAKAMGVKVDDKVLDRSRNYQQNNYDLKTNQIVTGKAAGVMLYSVSSSARASAQEARKAKDEIEKAKKAHQLADSATITEDNLMKTGMSRPEAQRYATAYKIQNAASLRAQDGDVMNGFGSNGGEEYLSYLMTGESLIIGGDNSWKTWYEKMSARLVQIQNNDGSWDGHHCITSPVFCTATCLLILSINKDIDFMLKLKGN